MPTVLPVSMMAATTSAITLDNFVEVQVWRAVAGDETLVATFQTRIAATSRAVQGRDDGSVQGSVSPQYYVLAFPCAVDIQTQDEVWTGGVRYRVVSVDVLPHESQAILLMLQ
jgi:hypothetical protein